MLRKIYLLLLACFTSISAFAQSGTIKGRVLDAANGEPLPFASVVAEMNGTQAGGGQTDFDGNFTIKPLSPGKYTLKASYVGYQSIVVTGITVSTDKITFQDLKLDKNTLNLKEVKVEAYKVPIIDKGNPSTQQTVTQEEIEAAPQRDVNSIASTTAGVFQKNEGDALNVRGSRSEATDYYIDGIKVRGSTGLPQLGIEQITVVTGGVPAQYGDATGGIINISTRGPSRNFYGGIELNTSELFDKYGYNLVTFNLSGPIVTKKHSDGSRTPLLGFFVSGEFEGQKDPNPSAVPVYKVKDDKLAELETTPYSLNAQGTGVIKNAELVTDDDLETIKANQNIKSKSYRISGKLDFQPVSQVNFSVGGSMNYNDRHNYTYTYSLFNPSNNSQTKDLTWRAFARVQHKLSSPDASQEKSASVIKNAYYSIQADYSKQHITTQDDSHEDRLFDYGYLGKFTSDYRPFYALQIVDGDTVYSNANIGSTYFGYTFEGAGVNPTTENYTTSYYNLLGEPQNPAQLQGGKGLLNGQRPEPVYSMWYNTGNQSPQYQVTDNSQFRVSASGSVDIKNHSIQLGFEYEQRKDAFYNTAPVNLWGAMRSYANSKNIQLDTLGTYFGTPGPGGYDSLFFPNQYQPQVLEGVGNVTGFYENIRAKLGYDPTSPVWIDIDSYDRSIFSMDLFTPDELLNFGIVGYAGYDYKGNKNSGNPSFQDYFSKLDPSGNYYLRPIAPFEPIYMAGFIQDKFAINDLIFNVGLRVDRFDANQKVLKDKYCLYQTRTAGEVAPNRPSNIGDDFVVYVSDVTDPSNADIVGYRDGEVWYDANGTVISDPGILAKQTNSGQIAPYLADPSEGVNDGIRKYTFDASKSFKDYEPQITFMPRIAFSFPISDQALFFAHYDVLTQRPSSNWRNIPSDYFNLMNGTLNNPDLKPEKTVDYELGFKQTLSRSSAISISAFYRDLQDMIQVRNINYAYPTSSYNMYDNYDFGTVKGLSFTYDLRRTGNIRLSASYTLQFADGTGSGSGSNAELVNNGQPNLRTLAPLDFDQRHTLVASIDYRYGSGSDYNGPMWFGKQFLSNFGVNLVARAGSGTPYSAISQIRTEANTIGLQQTGTGYLQGSVNGSRLPWQFRMDMRIDKDFTIKSSKKEGGKDLIFNVFFQILNLLNTKNVVNVYRATGNPDDDGYLNDPTAQPIINSSTSPESFVDLYEIKVNNPANYSQPRRIRLGIGFQF